MRNTELDMELEHAAMGIKLFNKTYKGNMKPRPLSPAVASEHLNERHLEVEMFVVCWANDESWLMFQCSCILCVFWT